MQGLVQVNKVVFVFSNTVYSGLINPIYFFLLQVCVYWDLKFKLFSMNVFKGSFFLFLLTWSLKLAAETGKITEKEVEKSIAIIDLKMKAGAYDSAIYLIDQLFPQLSDTSYYTRAELMGDKLQIYILTDRLKDAINAGLIGLAYAEKQQDLNVNVSLYSDLSYAYDQMLDTARAIKYAELALETAKKLTNKHQLLEMYSNLATSYSTYRGVHLNKAIKLYEKAYQLAVELKDYDSMGIALSSVGLIYKVQGDYVKAEKYMLRALDLFNVHDLAEGKITTLGKLGNLYTNDVKNCAKAITMLINAIELAKRNKIEIYNKDLYYLLADAYKKAGRYKEAYETQALFFECEQKNRSAEVKKEVEALNVKYETEKKNLQIEVLEENQRAETKIKWLLIAGILMAVLAALFSYRAYRSKQKYALFVAAEDRRKELLLQEIHHRVNNNLQVISSLLEMQADVSDNAVVQDYLQQSQSRIQSLSALHELLNENNASTDVNMKEYLHKVIRFHEDMLHLLDGRVVLEIDVANQSVAARMAVSIGLIVNELVTNAVKYAFPNERKGKIFIKLVQENQNQCVLTVSDDGVGMADKPSEKGTNLGLNLVHILTEQLNGMMNVKQDNGTVFQFRFNPSIT